MPNQMLKDAGFVEVVAEDRTDQVCAKALVFLLDILFKKQTSSDIPIFSFLNKGVSFRNQAVYTKTLKS